MEALRDYIRTVQDFPKPGILFYDITSLLEDPAGFKMALDAMEKFARQCSPDRILAVESRGFIFGGALADRLDLSLTLTRKSGKLPGATRSIAYDLEYGTDSLEIHADAIDPGDRVLLVDDLIATGGTILATAHLVEKMGGEVAGISGVIALDFLPWEEKLGAYDVDVLVRYETG